MSLKITTTNRFVTVEHITTITLDEVHLTVKKIGEFLETAKNDVPGSDGLQWWIRCYPTGCSTSDKGHVSMHFYVNKPVNAVVTFVVDGSSIQKSGTCQITQPSVGWKYNKFASHEDLWFYFSDGTLTISCIVELSFKQPVTSVAPHIFQLCNHVPFDFELVVGSNRMLVHKHFLSMISPVFYAMLYHDTAESRSGKDVIKDFKFDVVKSAIDFCYGRKLNDLSIENIVGVLRFADKYDIQAITTELEKLLNPTTETFCHVIRYAHDFDKKALLTDCYKCFKENQGEITKLDEFSTLSPTLVIDMLKAAVHLVTTFDILRYAHEHMLDFIMDDLEQPFIESMTLNDFCAAVKYAWDCSREDLKMACATYLIDHFDEVMNLKAFHKLPAKTIGKIMKTRYNLKRINDI